jgi:hypothetical protein
MATFTIQRSDTTGEVYVVEYDGPQAVRRYGPLDPADLQRLTPDTLHLVEFDDETTDEIWGVALEYRDGEWVSDST